MALTLEQVQAQIAEVEKIMNALRAKRNKLWELAQMLKPTAQAQELADKEAELAVAEAATTAAMVKP